MRRLVPICLLFAAPVATPLAAQARPDPAELLRSKLASPFLKRAPWTTDFDVARRRAAQEAKLVFGYFTTAGP